MRKNLLLLITFLFSLAAMSQNPSQPTHHRLPDPGTPPGALDLLAIHSGWYDDLGFHNPDNRNYLAGFCVACNNTNYRNFFVFDGGALGNFDVGQATLKIFAPTEGYSVFDASVYNVYIVTGDIEALMNGKGGLEAYQGIVDGTLVASIEITPEMHQNTFVEIPLSYEAVALIRNAQAQGRKFAFAGDLPNDHSGDNHVFGFTNGDPGSVLLTLEMGSQVPTLGEWGLVALVLGLMGAGFFARRRLA